jgi:extradiol dioxygenase family protein
LKRASSGQVHIHGIVNRHTAALVRFEAIRWNAIVDACEALDLHARMIPGMDLSGEPYKGQT